MELSQVHDSALTGIPIIRNDSEESTESPFGSALNTPADEITFSFDSLDAKLLSAGAPHVVEPSEKQAQASRTPERPARSPRRVSLSRQFSMAMDEANKSISPNGPLYRARSDSDGGFEPIPFPPLSNTSQESFSPAAVETASEEPQPKTPEPPVQDPYAIPSSQLVEKMTPRGRPLLRRDIFSPASEPVLLAVEDKSMGSVEFTPRVHSTIRHRKSQGKFKLLNDSITGEPASVGQEEVVPETELDEDFEEADDISAFLHLPQLSPLFPVQLILFPVWVAIVGASILLCPTYLNTVSFPASATRTSVSSLRTYILFLAQTFIVYLFPFNAPPSPIRNFAHWATVAHLHVAVFLAVLVGVAYFYLPVGVLLTAGCAGLFMHAWSDFSVDKDDGVAKEEELGGGDIRQTLYRVLLTPECGFGDGDKIKCVGGKYLLVRAQRRSETRAEILAAGGLDLDSESESDDEENDE
ncbi:Protoporphyrinogen oxidase [Favolaschia claudopus]|uniref:Protoporphyrinogen oxidase n=1 Tax=Favolaschia claudopus TaxID=2862362 RepID=A0AAW0BPA9_9AGAR